MNRRALMTGLAASLFAGPVDNFHYRMAVAFYDVSGDPGIPIEQFELYQKYWRFSSVLELKWPQSALIRNRFRRDEMSLSEFKRYLEHGSSNDSHWT